MKPVIKNNISLPCPKCDKPMFRKCHKQGDTKILKRPFYFSEWDYCPMCKHVQLYEQYKIFNNKEMEASIKYHREMKNSLNNL